MATQEKACIESYSAPQNLELLHCPPHNFLYDIPLQSREVAKQINVLEEQPVFSSMKLSASMTLPVFQGGNFNVCDLQKDPLRGILEDKDEFLNYFKQYAQLAEARYANDPEFAEVVDTSTGRESFLGFSTMINLAKILTEDPHPYFWEPYVWLPVGGSINHLSLGNKVFVLAPDGEKFDQIRAIPASEHCEWRQDGPISLIHSHPGQRVLQVVTSKHKKKGYVGVRRLRSFNVFRLKPSDEDGSLKSREVIDVSDPADALVALDIATRNEELACTLDKSNKVKVYNITAGKCTIDHQIVDEDTSRAATNKECSDAKFIQFSKQPFILYVVNKRKLYLKDIREPFTSSGTAFKIYDLSNGCEALSACGESSFSDTLYCSSTHHTYSLDPRRGWVKRWNHGLDDRPLYLNVGATEPTEEMIVTASLKMGSATGIINTWKETDAGVSQSFCSFPAALPSVRDTSFWANSKGYWLEPSISKRVESSLCGITLIPNQTSRGCSLFSLNAVGDIFCTTFRPDRNAGADSFMTHKSPEAEGRGLDCVKQWQESHTKRFSQCHIDLQCEDVDDRSYLLSIMKQHLNKDALARKRVHGWKIAIGKGRGLYRPRPSINKSKPLQKSKLEKIRNCKDWLASELLAFWDMNTLKEQAQIHNPEEINTVVLDSDDSD